MIITGGNRVVVRLVVVVGIIALFAILWLTGLLVTVKPVGEAKSLAAVMGGGHAFDKVKYVDSIWASRVVPTVERQSVDLDTLVAALQKSSSQACKEYGHNVGGACNFLVHFHGTVTKVDTATPIGTLSVAVPSAGGELTVKVRIGPIILGTSLRDALDFISFEQFLNQMQYGSVADQLNARVEHDVLSKIDLKTVDGKRVDIRGAFTYDGTSVKDIDVTPVTVAIR